MFLYPAAEALTSPCNQTGWRSDETCHALRRIHRKRVREALPYSPRVRTPNPFLIEKLSPRAEHLACNPNDK